MGRLSQLTVQPKTKERYSKAVERFYQYLRDNEIILPQQRSGLDFIVSEYLEFLWSDGEGRSLASDTLAGLQDRDPHLKGHLASSWRLLKTWMANEIPCRAPPLSELALQTLAGHALFQGQPVFCLSLLVAFYGLLRTGEVLGLRNKDISQTGPSSVAVISLGLTKGGKRAGAAESVTIAEEETLRRLWQWKQASSPGSSLCAPPHKWRKMFNDTISSLGLTDFQYRPYSLRRGGATFYFQRHGQLDRLLIQGRWQSAKTARLYINSGLATLAETELKLTPHARVFHKQFLRSQQSPLPQLEHATSGRAGGTGSTNSKNKKSRQRDKKGSVTGCSPVWRGPVLPSLFSSYLPRSGEGVYGGSVRWLPENKKWSYVGFWLMCVQ